jgi:hypothetical protein
MQLRFRSLLLILAGGFVAGACSISSSAEQAGSGSGAFFPQAADPQSGQTQSAQQPATSSDSPPPAPDSPLKGGASQNASSSQAPAQTQHQIAAEQIKEQEQQRVAGVLPEFNITYHWDAASMTAGQKMGLAFHTATDPYQFAAAFLVGGLHEALDDDTGFGWGAEGYLKRSGAAYLDAFDGNMIGNGVLPALLHQDPRYFRMGPAHGSVKHRILYSLATNVVCKHDNTGKWEPKSKIAGTIVAGAISNLYYPSQNSGWGQTIGNGMIVTAEGTIGSLFQEFWPDISRKFLHRDPTHGLDAQAATSNNAPTQK